MSRTAVVLMNLGGPASQAEVEPFLANLFSDVIRLPWGSLGTGLLGRFIARRRREHAQGLYRQIGGGSPILQETEAQAAALQTVLERVSGLQPWDHEQIEGAIRPLAEELGLKTGDLFGLIRVAVTGKTAAPPLFETMEVLGRRRSLERLDAALRRLQAQPPN